MSLEMMVWALKKDIKNSEFRILLNIANEADSSGVCYTGQKKLSAKSGLSIRTVKASIAELRKKDLLHTERRPADFARGRNVDAIILHPTVTHWDVPDTDDPEEIEYSRQLRKQYEYVENEPSPEENFQGAKSAPKYVSPSQTQGAKSAPSGAEPTFKVQKSVVQGANLSTKNETALKGTRARLTLNNPVIDQSITQSPNTSTGASQKEPATPVNDGVMIDSNHHEDQSICGIPTHRFISQLRTGLSRYGNTSTQEFSDEQLLTVAEEVLNRTDRTRVANLVGFCVTAIGNEDGGIPAILELIESRTRYLRHQALAEQEKAKLEAQANRLITCPVHHTQHTAGTQCSSCMADLKVATPQNPSDQPEEIIYGPDGKPLRGLALIKARREAKEQATS